MFKRNETGGNIELIYDVGETEKIDTVSIGMMRNNDIESLVPISVITQDNKVELKYKIENAVSLSEYLSQKLTKVKLLNIFENICNALSNIEEYMLMGDQTVLDEEHIFVYNEQIKLIILPLYNRKNGTGIVTFFKNLLLDMMVKNEEASYFVADITKQLTEENFSYNKFLNLIVELKQRKYFEKSNQVNISKKNTFNERRVNNIEVDPRPVINSAEIDHSNFNGNPVHNNQNYSNLNRGDGKNGSTNIPQMNNTKNTAFNTASTEKEKKKKKSFFSFGKDKEKETYISTNDSFAKRSNNSFLIPGREEPVNIGSKPEKEKKKFSLFGKKKNKEEVTDISPKNTRQHMPFNGTYPAETTILQNNYSVGETTVLGAQVLNTFLIWKRTGEKIFINKEIFRIGREKNYVDFCISDNTSVGRNHAEITRKDGGFFIKDLRSLNFTMVNGERIAPNIEMELLDSDIIQLANEELEFHVQP